MGGSQSTRKLSVDNENAIQVSQEAVDRIQAQINSKVSMFFNYIIYINVMYIKQNITQIFVLSRLMKDIR